MNNPYILPLDDKNATLESVGGKGASLARLIRAGLPVPGGFHITTEAYRQFVDHTALQPGILEALAPIDISSPQTLQTASQAIGNLFIGASVPQGIEEAIRQAYEALRPQTADGRPITALSGHPSAVSVAVRSSATAEDLPEASFAGQQETYLNVSGEDAVLDAVRKCWASLWTARSIGYRQRQEIDSAGVALAVVVQLMIPAEVAGILFTANPLNGQRGEAVINAAWGLGEAIVGGQVTPDTFTVEKSSGVVINRELAPKLIQTTRTASGVEQQPVPEHLQNLPTLTDEQALQLTSLGSQIEEIYGMPMDIEWTWIPHPSLPSPNGRGAGGEGIFHIVQARPITALPDPPLDWSPPDPKGVYMRASIVDLLPDPLSPLYITLGIPTFKAQMPVIGKRLLGSEPVLAEDYFTEINTYAYMNSSYPPKAIWWLLTGMLPAYPKLLKNLIPLWRDELHPEYAAYAAQLESITPSQMSNTGIWELAQEIVAEAMNYLCGIMFATMGASAGSEGLLTRVYEKMVRREGDPSASVLLMGWDNISIHSEKSLYDLARWCRERANLANYVQETATTTLAKLLAAGNPPAEVEFEEFDELRKKFQQHLKQFGHIIYQMDFAYDLPLDHPEPMLEMIKLYIGGEGVNPHKRQRKNEEIRIQTSEIMLERVKGLKGWIFRIALNWGQKMAEVREDAIAEIGLAFPKLREMLRELGDRFVSVGAITARDDIFWLEKEEIDQNIANLESDKNVVNLTGYVAERKAYWERAKGETPPPMLPYKERMMGIKSDLFIAHSGEAQTGDTLKGVPTSVGTVTAPARILLGPEDFDQMHPGDILVANTTTPAWTPLFSMAVAVVTDIGGPLSHGSIVAREFGIPAVMGTGVATKRIQSGQTITVDGNAGTIKIHNGD
ncbi:MAG: hypothetical protein ISR58_04860 [Anaerolineales bacterium]|nr:hypothetical protein [Anaerolineales bacterium]